MAVEVLKSKCRRRHHSKWYASKPRQSKHVLRHRGDVPRYDRHRVQLDEILRLWLEIRSQKQAADIHHVEGATPNARLILAELEAMMKEQDEPDFRHCPTEHAYKIARESIENAYTHYLGSAPAPAIAPDGDGGLIVEWKSGQLEVRLIAAPSKELKSYVYSRGAKIAQIDYDTSGLILAQRLRSTFA